MKELRKGDFIIRKKRKIGKLVFANSKDFPLYGGKFGKVVGEVIDSTNHNVYKIKWYYPNEEHISEINGYPIFSSGKYVSKIDLIKVINIYDVWKYIDVKPNFLKKDEEFPEELITI